MAQYRAYGSPRHATFLNVDLSLEFSRCQDSSRSLDRCHQYPLASFLLLKKAGGFIPTAMVVKMEGTMGGDGSSILISKGTLIFDQGALGDCAYIIEEGEVEIFIRHGDERIVLGRRHKGDIFGEMAIMDQTHRSASAIATEPCKLLAISRDQLAKRIERTDPVLRLCLDVILKRFRETINQWTKVDVDGNAPPPTTQDRLSKPFDQETVFYEIKLEQALQQALDREEFEVHYQPIVSLRDKRIAGFEALIRWRHPERGLISPAWFLPVAEASGLIVEIGHWVLDQACRALLRFDQATSDGRDLFMSVNVSSKDFEDGNFLQRLDQVLTRRQLDPTRLKLEITESLLMARPDLAIDSLKACKDRGVEIAIDDFGIGYSSLGYLHTLPMDVLKIDRSFVHGLDKGHAARDIIATIITLADQLELPIIAEGIEHTSQVECLLGLGCELGQGFLFSKPTTEERTISILNLEH